MGQDDNDEAEQLSSRRGATIVYKNGNGNGALNRIVWAAAGLFVIGVLTINGFMWKTQIDSSRDIANQSREVAARLSALEAQMTIVLSRQQP